MGKRRLNPNLAKIHRSYSVEEVANLYGVHKNTVRIWVKGGKLPTCDKKRPMLILGCDLRDFLQARRGKNKCRLKPGEIYCVRCRAPKVPDENMADYKRLSETQGNLIGICPSCETIMYRRISLARIEQVRGQLVLTLPQGLPRINDSEEPSVNSDLK